MLILEEKTKKMYKCRIVKNRCAMGLLWISGDRKALTEGVHFFMDSL